MITTLSTSRYRTPPMLGEFQGVDRKAGVIRGVAVAQLGPIAEQDPRKQLVDETTFSQFMQLAASPKGIKARFTHPDMSNDGMGTFLGRWRSPRIDGRVARFDLHISPRSHESPTLGDVGKYVMDLAESDPDMFGASMSVLLDQAAMENAQNADGYQPIRIKQLFAVDIVDTPALTSGGLFSVGEGIPERVSSLLDSHFAGMGQSDVRERALGYLERYLTNRYGVENMSDTNIKPAGLTQESLDAALKAFGEQFSTKVDERIKAALANKPAEKTGDAPAVTDSGPAERKRATELFALAEGSGLEDYAALYKEALSGGLSAEEFGKEISKRRIASNGVSKDSGQAASDPDAKYKKEYAANRAAFAAMGVTEQEYVTSCKVEDGSELLAPAAA